ncbi:MAG: hypothetical protein H6627_09310 [Calditrichae bacterium]|nr:hypothetical protein [Calditrichia bacterium]
MKRICAWCNTEISNTKAEILDYSHGICASCAELLILNFKIPLDVFLHEMNVPVLIVDSKGKIKEANKTAKNFFGEDTFTNIKAGDLLECKNAKLAGGCGNTPNCSGCALRNLIFETYLTGQKLSNMEIQIDRKTEGTYKKLMMNISTEKTGEYVYLIINSLL